MLIHIGNRTDIPAFYSDWLANRLREGFVLVRNPYNPVMVVRYELNPSVVDGLIFCTKNPAPMFRYFDLLKPYRQFWFVTITPYGADIEPNVPPKEAVMEDLIRLSKEVGPQAVVWRYDPILLSERYTIEYHLQVFEHMAAELAGSTRVCVISFLDLFEKVMRNFPEARHVSREDQRTLTESFVQIGKMYDMIIRVCGEGRALEKTGADCNGCLTVPVLEKALGVNLNVPPQQNTRRECTCCLAGDIGQYDTCGHLCRYCYANTDRETVRRNMRCHDPRSPLLIGRPGPADQIHPAVQKSWVDPQMRLDLKY